MKDKLLKIEAWILNIPTKIRHLYELSIKHLITIASKMQDLGTTNYELGLFHINQGNIPDATMRFIFVTKLKKEFAPAHYHLARCYLMKADNNKAKLELENALLFDPSLSLAKYRLDVINNSFKEIFIPIEIIKEDYNSLALKYEDLMINQQGYIAHEELAEGIAATIEKKAITKEGGFECLDLGCGSGLSGASLVEKVAVKSLFGIDISIKMLELAKTLEMDQKLVYYKVKEDDLNNLEIPNSKFDIIISCLSFSYANDLANTFTNLEKVCAAGTILGLVVLKSETGKDIEFNYKYTCLSFSEKFLKNIFKKNKWVIEEEKDLILFTDNTIGYMAILVKK